MPDQVPSTANQSGLSENAACGLAYITVIPAIVFLLVEPYNRNRLVRFHAWQCIWMAIAWICVDLAIGFLGLFIPFIHVAAYGMYPVIALAMLILWLMVLIKAFNGEKLKLPVVGELAEKEAAK